MKVSMMLYGDRAQELSRLLKGNTELTMNAHFKVKDVEGHIVIEASFTANDPQPKNVTSVEQKAKETLEFEEKCAELRAELKAMMQ